MLDMTADKTDDPVADVALPPLLRFTFVPTMLALPEATAFILELAFKCTLPSVASSKILPPDYKFIEAKDSKNKVLPVFTLTLPSEESSA